MKRALSANSLRSRVLSRGAIENLKGLALIVGLLVLVLTPVILFQKCGRNREAARRQLEGKSIAFTEEEFVKRVQHRDFENVKLFLAAGINPNARTAEGATVLMDAVVANDSRIMEELLNNGADVSATRDNGSTALHSAALVGNYEGARMLVRKNADVNASNNEGETPLMIAALKGYPENVKLLLEAGANLNMKDKRGETPLMHAIERNHTEVVELLKSAGAKQ